MLSLSALRDVRVLGYTSRPPAWTFDLDAIGEACEHLGVRQPVDLGCALYLRGRYSGTHGYERGRHTVNVGSSLDADEASRTIWHELTHAQQRERIGPRFSVLYLQAGGGKGGRERNRYEHAAERMEDMAREFPLVRS